MRRFQLTVNVLDARCCVRSRAHARVRSGGGISTVGKCTGSRLLRLALNRQHRRRSAQRCPPHGVPHGRMKALEGLEGLALSRCLVRVPCASTRGTKSTQTHTHTSLKLWYHQTVRERDEVGIGPRNNLITWAAFFMSSIQKSLVLYSFVGVYLVLYSFVGVFQPIKGHDFLVVARTTCARLRLLLPCTPWPWGAHCGGRRRCAGDTGRPSIDLRAA